MNIPQDNKLIAEFMGWEKAGPGIPTGYFNSHNDYFDYEDLQFHSSWDWLMPVIVKIADDTAFELVSGYDYSYWNNMGHKAMDKEFGGYGNGIEAIHEAVVEFIKWHNEQHKDKI